MSLKIEAAEDLIVLPEPLRWVVVHTRPRCEKKLADAAEREGIRAYVPLIARTHAYGRRKRTFLSPLFTGYAFCCGDAPQRRWLSQNQNTANLLDVFDQETLVVQLRHVQTALKSGLLVDVKPFLETGRQVRITSGPLRGAEGVIVRISGKMRVLLSVDMIQQAAVVEVDSAALAPL
ncbi:MAG: KOW motif-containing protein [Kiritimatiellae bacterium]|nr:KOW motif-containing protein [Kiritimatiellia bacterium]